MSTAEEYMDLASKAYDVDRLHRDPPLHVGEKFTAGPEAHEQDYLVIDVEDHAANGFQAMAVAPLVNGVPDLSHIVVSYAGTNPEHRADILEDAETVVGIAQGPLSRATDAQRFADRVSKAHPDASVSTVGHSLGGFLALLVSAEHGWEATTFNGPDPWQWLSPAARERLDADTRADRKRMTNYVIEFDLIANLNPHRTGAAVFLTARPGLDPLRYHNLGKGKDSVFQFTDGELLGVAAHGRRYVDILANMVDSFVPGISEALSPALLMLTGVAADPAARRTLGKDASAALVAVNSVSALGLAASIAATAAALTEIKQANARIIPRMEEGLRAAKNAAAGLPTITVWDIEQCIDTHRLHVHQNVDTDAIRAVDEQVDRHLVRVGQLSDGIIASVRHTIEQDAEWAITFAQNL